MIGGLIGGAAAMTIQCPVTMRAFAYDASFGWRGWWDILGIASGECVQYPVVSVTSSVTSSDFVSRRLT